MSDGHYLANKAYFSAITVKTFMRVLPTRWRRSQLALRLRHYRPIYTSVKCGKNVSILMKLPLTGAHGD